MRAIYTIENVNAKAAAGLSLNEKRFYDKWHILPKKFHLTLGKEYTIYGIEFTGDGFENFIVVDDTGNIYPKFYPSEFFLVTDNRISKYWVNCIDRTYPFKFPASKGVVSFERFVNDNYFYHNLIEGEKSALLIFQAYQKKMDMEFPFTNLKTAEIVDEHWIQCAYCGNIWQENSTDGVVICPENSELNNNPLWTTSH